MHSIILAASIAIVLPAVSWAALPGANDKAGVRSTNGVQVADYYSGKKHCRKVGSATVCN